MKPRHAIKKPVEIQYIQLDGTEESASEIVRWIRSHDEQASLNPPQKNNLISRVDNWTVLISTFEGRMTASRGDYVIRGVEGEFYPCKPSIFIATYNLED